MLDGFLAGQSFSYQRIDVITSRVMNLDVDYSQYLGKKNHDGTSYHLLPYHCLDVAAVGRNYVDNNPRLKSLFTSHTLFANNPGLLPFLLALHDVGKFSKPFQEKIQLNVDNQAGHTAEGWDILTKFLTKGLFSDYLDEKTPEKKTLKSILEILFEPIAGHHGIPVSVTGNDHPSYRFGESNLKDAESFVLELAHLFLPEINFAPLDKDGKKKLKADTKYLSWVLAGICVTADWIASNESFFPWELEVISLADYWKSVDSRALNLIERTGLCVSPISDEDTIESMFGFSPRPLQRVIEDLEVEAGPNLYIIEESTGGGKTEAALLLVKKLMKAGCGDGFYFALPTMATANAMYERITGDAEVYTKFYSGNLPVSVVLAHGQTLLSDRFQDFIGNAGRGCYEEKWIYDNNKKALLSSIGVGTVDQMLMGGLPFRHQSLRLLGCAKNILVIDEVHSYDSYMNKLLANVLQYHKELGGSAVILSATLSKEQKEMFLNIYAKSPVSIDSPAYPLISTVNGEGVFSEIVVPPSPDKYSAVSLVFNETDVLERIHDVVKNGGCACWIRNTVNDSLVAYSRLKSIYGDSVLLFHARFAMGDRLDRENEVLRLFGKSSTLKEREGKILVATQVVEQSLDLDFDFLISDLAPIDLLIQRAGRLWRHVRERPSSFTQPEMMIYSPNPLNVSGGNWYSSVFPGGGFVYPEHGKLWRAADILLRHGGFSMPGDARYLIDSVYSSGAFGIPEVLQYHELEAERKDASSKAHGTAVSLNLAHGYKREIAWLSDEVISTREGKFSVAVELRKGDRSSSSFWCTGKHAYLSSRLSLLEAKARKFFGEPDDDGVYRLYLKYVDNFWVPCGFEDTGIYYSKEEGLVFPI